MTGVRSIETEGHDAVNRCPERLVDHFERTNDRALEAVRQVESAEPRRLFAHVLAVERVWLALPERRRRIPTSSRSPRRPGDDLSVRPSAGIPPCACSLQVGVDSR